MDGTEIKYMIKMGSSKKGTVRINMQYCTYTRRKLLVLCSIEFPWDTHKRRKPLTRKESFNQGN